MENNVIYITLQTGERAVAINKNDGNIAFNSNNEVELKTLEMDSIGLKTWKSDIKGVHVDRKEVADILNWVHSDKNAKAQDRVALVVGNAGMGKSVIMSDVLKKLEDEDIPVLGIKLDKLHFYSMKGLDEESGVGKGQSIISVYEELNKRYNRSVILIDQIDALSMSLSSDRRSMDVASLLIRKLNTLPNVRIIISCRRFDLDFDYTLKQFDIYSKFYINELPEEEVNKILVILKVNPNKISARVKKFLGTPINLYLYSLINKPDLLNGEALTLQRLYDELWSQMLRNSTDRTKLNDFLSEVVTRMYNEQTLTINGRIFQDKYEPQLTCLLSNGFMVGDIDNGIQFLHQSLFDYTYARKFIESGKSIIDELKCEHQGLFVRSRVRQVLLYMRELSTRRYLKILDDILFKLDKNQPVIRFHIKVLALNALGLCENITKEEKQYFKDKVLSNSILGPIFVNSANSRSWFRIIAYESNYGLELQTGNADKELTSLMTSLCWRIFTLDEDLVLDYLEQLTKSHNTNLYTFVFYIICHLGWYGKNWKKLFELFDRVKGKDSFPQSYDFLRKALEVEPSFVANELKRHIQVCSDNLRQDIFDRFKVDSEASTIFDELKEKSLQLAYEVSLYAIHIVFDKTTYSGEVNGLKMSSEFISYERNRLFSSNSVTDFFDFALDYTEKQAKKEPNEIKDQLSDFLSSNRWIDIMFPIVGYSANPTFFKNEIFSLLTNKEWLYNMLSASTVLDYNIKLMFKSSFMLFAKVDQRKILNTLINLYPDWESMAFKDHTKYDQPMTEKGRTFGKFIHILDQDDYIKENFHDIYIKYDKVKDKFKYLETDVPNKMETRSGWTGVPKSAYDNMSDEDWLKLMKKYNKDVFNVDFDKPTMTGISMQFKQKVMSDPQHYADFIIRANADSSINISYILSGFEGLAYYDENSVRKEKKQKGNDKIDKEEVYNVFSVIAKRFDGDINKFGDASLWKFLRSIRYFLVKEYMPKDVFDFICKAVREAKEDDDANNEKDMQPYQIGINRARGVAGELLVDCSYLGKEYEEGIFSTLESVADNLSVTTRAAVMLNMARLNWLNPERSLQLYLQLMHDYKPSLMAMPVHDMNPLVYYINYGFDELVPLFEKAIDIPPCHQAMTQILWFAFIKHKDGAEPLLHKMINASREAALNFFKVVERYNSTVSLMNSMDYLLELMKSDDEEIIKNVEIIYGGFKYWNDNELETFTEAFVHNECCKYASRSFYECMSSFIKKKPKKVLKWILEVYRWKKDSNNEHFDIQKILEILTMSYNAVRKYDLHNKVLESAMDTLDEILEDSEKRQYLSNFLNELDYK